MLKITMLEEYAKNNAMTSKGEGPITEVTYNGID
jgi:hypothetical protein